MRWLEKDSNKQYMFALFSQNKSFLTKHQQWLFLSLQLILDKKQ